MRATRVVQPLGDGAVRREVIGKKQLQEKAAQSLEDALSDHLGVTTGARVSYTQGAPAGGIQLLGCDARRVLILYNGRRFIGGSDGILDAAQLSLGAVRRVEVIKGSASALYGADAICGVINIVPRQPPRRGAWLSFSADYGSLNSHRLALALGARLSPHWGLQLEAGYRARDGFDLDPETAGTDGDAQRLLGGRLRLQYAPLRRLRINLSAGYQLELREGVLPEAFPGMFAGSTYATPRALQRPGAALSAQVDFNRTDQLTVRVYSQHFFSDSRQYQLDGDARRRRLTDNHYVNAALFGRVKLGRWNLLLAGFEGTWESLRVRRAEVGRGSDGSPYELDDLEVPTKTVSTQELFIQDEMTPWKWLTVVPGLRYVHHQRFGHHVVPKLSVLAQPAAWLKIRAVYGAGFRAPTLKNLYYLFDHSELGIPLLIKGNPSLTEETSQSLRASLEFFPYRRASILLAGFFTHYRNLIDNSPIEFDQGLFVIEKINIGRAHTAGLELGFRFPFAKHFELAGGYVWLHARVLSDQGKETGKILPNRPEHHAKLLLRFHHRRWGTRLTVYGTYQTRVFVDEDNDKSSPGYPMLNLFVAQRVWRGLSLYLRGVNLTNSRRNGADLLDLRPQPGWMLFGGITGNFRFGRRR